MKIVNFYPLCPGGGGNLGTDGEVQRPFWGLKFAVRGLFGVWNFVVTFLG